MPVIINCDMGEGMGNDAVIMPFIHAANIACCYHAGDEKTMKQTVNLCLQNNVAIGAHPSFFDRENFGRIEQALPPNEIYNLVAEQLKLLKNITNLYGAKVNHVKPHGALYNLSAKNKMIANAIAAAVYDFDPELVLYGLSNSLSIEAAREAGLKAANEVFADRTYQDDASLTSRKQTGALIENKEQMIAQVIKMADEQTVVSVSGKKISLPVDTICIHGDGVHALDYAKEIHKALFE